jgi:hypothetical protein
MTFIYGANKNLRLNLEAIEVHKKCHRYHFYEHALSKLTIEVVWDVAQCRPVRFLGVLEKRGVT